MISLRVQTIFPRNGKEANTHKKFCVFEQHGSRHKINLLL